MRPASLCGLFLLPLLAIKVKLISTHKHVIMNIFTCAQEDVFCGLKRLFFGLEDNWKILTRSQVQPKSVNLFCLVWNFFVEEKGIRLNFAAPSTAHSTTPSETGRQGTITHDQSTSADPAAPVQRSCSEERSLRRRPRL